MFIFKKKKFSRLLKILLFYMEGFGFWPNGSASAEGQNFRLRWFTINWTISSCPLRQAIIIAVSPLIFLALQSILSEWSRSNLTTSFLSKTASQHKCSPSIKMISCIQINYFGMVQEQFDNIFVSIDASPHECSPAIITCCIQLNYFGMIQE